MLELSVNRLWRKGPEWLVSDASDVCDPEPIPMSEQCLQELKTSSRPSHTLVAVEGKPNIGEVMSCTDFSSCKGYSESLHMLG